MRRRSFLIGLAAGAAAAMTGARPKLACPYCHSTRGTRGEGKFGKVLSQGLPVSTESILCECGSVFMVDPPPPNAPAKPWGSGSGAAWVPKPKWVVA